MSEKSISQRHDAQGGAGSWRWRYESAKLPAAPATFADEESLDRAWLLLLIQHMPFRATDEDEYGRLITAFRDLETTFLDDPELQRYYAESTLSDAEAPQATAADPGLADAPTWKVGHVVMLQAQLMEDVFYSLGLDRFANAPDNRGWMNLFRRWGRSPTFNTLFNEVRETFTREFVDFYDLFVREYARGIDMQPIPHPWDTRQRRKLTRTPAPMGPLDREWLSPEEVVQRRALKREEREIPGVFLDSGIREAAPSRIQSPRAEPGQHGTERAEEQAPGSTASSGGAAPPGSSAPPASGGGEGTGGAGPSSPPGNA